MPTSNVPIYDLAFLVSEANNQRSREVGLLLTDDQILPSGTLVDGAFSLPGGMAVTHKIAATGAAVTGILAYTTDPTNGPTRATFIVRDAEVNDAYLIPPGDKNMSAAATALSAFGVIVRTGVLASPGGTFASTKANDPNTKGTVYDIGHPALATITGGSKVTGGESVVSGGGVVTISGGSGGVYPTVPGGPG